MGVFDFFKPKPVVTQQPVVNAMPAPKPNLDYPIADFQWEFVRAEVKRLDALLKTLDCTKKLHIDSNALTPDSYFRYEPFTQKTGKISKYPCMLHACSTVYMGFSASIWYDINDIIGKGQMHIATKSLSYTIDFKSVAQNLLITKVITTDSNLDNHKLYHIQKDGTVFMVK